MYRWTDNGSYKDLGIYVYTDDRDGTNINVYWNTEKDLYKESGTNTIYKIIDSSFNGTKLTRATITDNSIKIYHKTIQNGEEQFEATLGTWVYDEEVPTPEPEPTPTPEPEMKSISKIKIGDEVYKIKSNDSYHPPILSCMWSDHLIDDMDWLRADTFSWQDGNVYKTSYDTLVDEYATGITETEGNITFKRSANGFKIADATQEGAIFNKYNADGVAWYYILDIPNRRFKLPRTKWGFKGLRDNVGNDISESLPNIRGTVTEDEDTRMFTGQYANGAFKVTNSTVTNFGNGSGTGLKPTIFEFDASLSSSTYQDGAPVQERGTQMYLYFYVGEFSREAIEQTAGLNAELFNGKVDVSSLSDVIPVVSRTVSGTSQITIWADGYCEQKGFIVRTDTKNTVSLVKEFLNTDYNINVQVRHTEDNTDGRPILIREVTTTSFTINSYTRYQGFYWEASGMLAQGLIY